jgi:hypothetical protein
MEWNFFTVVVTIFVTAGVLLFPMFLMSKKETKKRNDLLSQRISEQNAITGFKVTHTYLLTYPKKDDIYISLDTKEIISCNDDKIHLGHLDSVINVAVETYSSPNGSSYCFFLHLTFSDCKKITITIRDTDEMIYWHNLLKKIV